MFPTRPENGETILPKSQEVASLPSISQTANQTFGKSYDPDMLKSLRAQLDDPLLSGIPVVKTLRFSEGEVLFQEGETLAGIYYLKSGCVKTVVNRPLTRGRVASPEFINKIVGPGEAFGFKSLIQRSKTAFHAQAVKDSEVIVYSADFLSHGTTAPHPLFRCLLLQMAEDLQSFETISQLHYLASVQERIAYQLVLLTHKFGVPVPEGLSLNLKLSRNELAQLAGTINESLSRHLTEFRNENIIDVHGKEIIVKDLDALKRKSGNFRA